MEATVLAAKVFGMAGEIVAKSGADMLAHGEKAVQLTVTHFAAALHGATGLDRKVCGEAAKLAIFTALAERYGAESRLAGLAAAL